MHRKQTTIRKRKNTKAEDNLFEIILGRVDTAKKTNETTKRKTKDREDNSLEVNIKRV